MRLFLFTLLAAVSLLAQPLTVTSDDGFELKGEITLPRGEGPFPLVLLAHQFAADRHLWDPMVPTLLEMGCAVLAVDLRGHGESVMRKGKKVAVPSGHNFAKADEKVDFSAIPGDLSLWLEAAEAFPINDEKVILVGSSLGAISILALLADAEPAGVVVLSPGNPDAMGKENVDLALRTYTGPILYVAAKDDPLGSGKRILDYPLYGQKQMRIITGGNLHGFVLFPMVEGQFYGMIREIVSE